MGCFRCGEFINRNLGGKRVLMIDIYGHLDMDFDEKLEEVRERAIKSSTFDYLKFGELERIVNEFKEVAKQVIREWDYD